MIVRTKLILIVCFFISAHARASPISDADFALQKGEYETAIQKYRKILEQDPKSYEARFGLARALSFAGYRKAAVDIYSEMISEYPQDPDLRLGRGRVFAWEKRFEEAQGDLVWVTQQFPKYEDAWSALGDLYLWMGKTEVALNTYSKCVELSPQNARYYIIRAKAYMIQRKFSEARKDLYSAQSLSENKDEVNKLLREIDRTPSAFTWEGSFSYGFESFTPSRPEGQVYTSSIKREFTKGSLALELIKKDQFSLSDEAVAFDSYMDLWTRSYGNFRYQLANDVEISPRYIYSGEIFQGFGKGWEISTAYRHMDFPSDNVDICGVSIGKYIGSWYLRGKTAFSPASSDLDISHSISLRWYYDTVDDFIDIGAGVNHEKPKEDYSCSFKIQKFLFPEFGFFVSFVYHDEETILSRGMATGFLVRW